MSPLFLNVFEDDVTMITLSILLNTGATKHHLEMCISSPLRTKQPDFRKMPKLVLKSLCDKRSLEQLKNYSVVKCPVTNYTNSAQLQLLEPLDAAASLPN